MTGHRHSPVLPAPHLCDEDLRRKQIAVQLLELSGETRSAPEVLQIPLRVVVQVGAGADPDGAPAAARIVVHDDPRNLAALANPRAVADEEARACAFYLRRSLSSMELWRPFMRAQSH